MRRDRPEPRARGLAQSRSALHRVQHRNGHLRRLGHLRRPLDDAIAADLPRHTEAVRLDAERRLFWEAGTGQDREVWRNDPGATLRRRFIARLVSALPLVENQL